MKRANNDDREAKRSKSMVKIKELEAKIKDLRAQNRFEETIPLCEDILSRNDRHTRAHYWISAGLDTIGDIEKRDFHLQKCVDCPEHVIQSFAFYSLGVIAEDKNELDQARIYYERALNLKDDFTNNCVLGMVLFHKNLQNFRMINIPPIIELSKKALSLSTADDQTSDEPNISSAHFFIGRCYDLLETDVDQSNYALEHFEKAIELADDEKAEKVGCSHFYIATILEHLGEIHKARERYRKSVDGYSGGWVNEAYLRLSTAGLRESEESGKVCFERSMMQYCKHRYDDTFLPENYETFNGSLSMYDPEKWAEIQPILNDPITTILGERCIEWFTKWARLMDIHKRKIKEDFPVVHENLSAIAEKSRFILIHVNDVFTDQTILIIHDFLYHM